jgi:hypothetical protein
MGKRKNKRFGSKGTKSADTSASYELARAEPEKKSKRSHDGYAVHQYMFPAAIYKDLVGQLAPEDEVLAESTHSYVLELFTRIKPRDPIEEMLVGQMLLTHARLARLSSLAGLQQNVKWSSHLHEAADRAANTFRRQMLALAEYRRPPRSKSFTAIGQANIANQQVVQNGKSENKNMTNEQGSRDGESTAASTASTRITASGETKALSTEPAGSVIAAGDDRPNQAVVEKHRPADRKG